MNQIFTSEGNIMFVKANGKITNVHPFNVYTHFNTDTVSFILVALPESSGLAFFTSRANDLEIDGETYTFNELKVVIPEKFKMSGAQARCEVVSELPSSGMSNTIYLVLAETSGSSDIYDEYVWLVPQNKWELLGNTRIDMSNYYTKDEVDDLIEQNTLTAGDGIDIVNNVISFSSEKEETISSALNEIHLAVEELEDSVSGKADTSAVTESINAAVSGKADVSYVDTALSGKQDTLTAGTSIDITNNVISVTGVTVDQTIIENSTNAVAGGAVYAAIGDIESLLSNI